MTVDFGNGGTAFSTVAYNSMFLPRGKYVAELGPNPEVFQCILRTSLCFQPRGLPLSWPSRDARRGYATFVGPAKTTSFALANRVEVVARDSWAIVRACEAAGRADLIEQGLIDRQHVVEVRAKIVREVASHHIPAGPVSGRTNVAFNDWLAIPLGRRVDEESTWVTFIRHIQEAGGASKFVATSRAVDLARAAGADAVLDSAVRNLADAFDCGDEKL